jgi:hypothetical protein
MKILVVNCFEETRQGNAKFRTFHRLLCGWLADSEHKDAVGSYDMAVRRLNNLHEYVLDWEYDLLDDNGKNITRRFDNLSLIVVIGDMTICPWSLVSSQLTTLLWMAELSKKPTLCLGSGAFAAVYAAAGQGTKFDVLNGPNGESVEKLPRFPRYSKTQGQFPGVWLDNETGDLYSYGTQFNNWTPICNIGIYR